MHTCPMVNGLVPHVGGPILPPCQPNVFTGGMPQARVSDRAVCVGPPDVIAKGSTSVFVGGQPAARMFDQTVHGGVIVVGFPTVFIGDWTSGGGGGAVDGGGGEAAVSPHVEGAGGDHAAMAKTLKIAAKEGVPFCEQCAKAAAAGHG
jgi:uncharacterized Zn-binding protein involved in type VI secretion